MKLIRYGIMLSLLCVISLNAFSAEKEITEEERQKLNDKFDKQKIRHKHEFLVDTSDTFLKRPKDDTTAEDFTIAKVAPEVKFMIVPNMEPEYFDEHDEAYMIAWANWARVTRSEDNRFFFSVSDHLGFGCHINIYEYNPGRNVVFKLTSVGEIVGWTDQSYTDGKIHGHMGIMPDGTMWAATHYGVHPDSTWWANGYRGSWLISYNINTHESKNWGVPLIGNMLPCFNVDTKRGRLVGTGANYTVLCWDCFNKKVTYAGYPPNGWEWWRRAMLCDEDTGKFWTSDNSDGNHRLMSFDPELNKFERYEVAMPPNTYQNNKVAAMRGYTDHKAADGYFYGGTYNGAMFKFKSEGENGPEIVPLGVTWGEGQDVLQMPVSPGGRYVYYQPRTFTSPLVQYDVRTGKKKALCWLQDYYFEKYGYYYMSIYGLEISKDGSFIVMCVNGTFQGKGKTYGHPSLIVVEIPETERQEDW
ncbi:MAG: hypothetical protein JXB48_01115 [Candidatus Latescibacteria bacterium]|nr:hypothetical protein [Candidatus Latescibacterota bacterium]